MKRVMIIGGSGSGKSTLARKLGEMTGLPVIHADCFQFEKYWKQVPENERNAKLEQATSFEEWIIDGNYSATWSNRASRADTIIFLDTPRHVRLWRVFVRTLKYFGTNRPDMPEGCAERFDWGFIKWTWEYDERGRDAAVTLIYEARSDQQTFIFKTLGQIDDWLTKMGSCDHSLSP